MNLIKCDACLNYFEEGDMQKVEQRVLCYCCTKECKNCHQTFDKRFDSEYCYTCLEGNLV